jgi:hypothetical protein
MTNKNEKQNEEMKMRTENKKIKSFLKEKLMKNK